MPRVSDYPTEDFNTCPKCGSHLMVIDSRAAKDSRRRRYRCSKRRCGFRYSTREIANEVWKDLERRAQMPEHIRTFIAAIKQLELETFTGADADVGG